MIEITASGTLITGASDDLIEIRGELYEEFSSYECQNGGMALSDGTILNVNYDDYGIWRFAPIIKGDLFESIELGSVDEDTNDTVYFKNGLKWCVFSGNMQSVINNKK